MGIIILLFYVIPYLAVSTVVMVITVKYAKKIWIRGIVAAALFLIPTYDIIITNILGAYYCATAPKAFIKETVEYPESIYFERQEIYGYGETTHEFMIGQYLNGVSLKTLALNLPDGNVAIYHYEKNQDEYDKIVQEVKQELGEKSSHYKDIKARIVKMIESNKIITTKDKMPKINYTAIFDEIKLDKFSSNFLIATEFKLINNKTSEIIAYKREYHNYYYNMFPNLSTGGKINWKSFCDCEKLDKEIGVIFLDEYL
ncbi:hypothetical protein H7R39_06125 [Campylobacter sp. Marseille-Q3452]|uniref:Uncharacterized protein n=1 Tax=Campylobacter massiliensis TaxID=2762557 RepID=A0A842JBL1_9BACT|nr:hypothetical protein [Campylobacter massiliensis]MBC2882833.1 hypothetical protein [Campylobacter massiliensis]